MFKRLLKKIHVYEILSVRVTGDDLWNRKVVAHNGPYQKA